MSSSLSFGWRTSCPIFSTLARGGRIFHSPADNRGEQFIGAPALSAPHEFRHVILVVYVERNAGKFNHSAICFGRPGLRQMFGKAAGAEARREEIGRATQDRIRPGAVARGKDHD